MSGIACAEHGVSPGCLICRHLPGQRGRGYFAIPFEPAEPDEAAQAWCEDCDRVLVREQGWTDAADRQADWRLYCTGCYEDCLRAHVLRSWAEGTSPDD